MKSTLIKRDKSGYIYILLRADFIRQGQYIYKIGETQRHPPHRRLWDYPYGSLFLALFKTHSALAFEKTIKQQLNQHLICRKDHGVEYFEGDLSLLLQIITDLYPKYRSSTGSFKTLSGSMDELYLKRLNHIHYIVNYRSDYFAPIYKLNWVLTLEDFESKLIYDAYQKARQWNTLLYPDNYVIRVGSEPTSPNRIMTFDPNQI